MSIDFNNQLDKLQHELEVSRAANIHLGKLASERASEVEALEMELEEIAKGDEGIINLVEEQRKQRVRVRELKTDLEQVSDKYKIFKLLHVYTHSGYLSLFLLRSLTIPRVVMYHLYR